MNKKENTCVLQVSLDRYWSIRWPSWYRQHNSVRKTIIALILTWFYMHITFFPYYLYDRIVNDYGKYDCFWDLTLNRRFCIPVVILGYFLPLGVMIYCNCLIGCYVIKRARRVETSDLDDGKKGIIGIGASTHFSVFRQNGLLPFPSTVKTHTYAS